MTYHGICVNQNGTLDPCCQYARPKQLPVVGFSNIEYFTNYVRQQLKDDAAAGQRHTGCQKCWSEEDSGLTSLRQFANRWYPVTSSDFFVLDQHGNMDHVPIYHLELRLGNFCNLKCIMCTEGSSSAVLAERTQHRDLYSTIGIYPYNPNIEPWWESESFLDFCQQRLFQHVRRVNITGGEPFIIPEVLNILDRLITREQQCTVCFNTNLTKLSNRMIDKLKQFSRLEIIISLEGIGEKNNYVRYPSQWSEIEQNIELLRKHVPQARISVNHTLQHTSTYSLPELAEYCYNNQLSWHITTVQGADFLTFDSVPTKDLEQFDRWISTSTVLTNEQQKFLKNTVAQSQYSTELSLKFQEYTRVLDQIRNTDYHSVFNPSI